MQRPKVGSFYSSNYNNQFLIWNITRVESDKFYGISPIYDSEVLLCNTLDTFNSNWTLIYSFNSELENLINET